MDFRGRAHCVEIGSGRFFDARVMLRDDSEALFFAVQRIEQGERTLPAHGDGLNSARK